MPAGTWVLLQSQKRHDAAVINEAGRQRMLVQKMAALSYRVARGEGKKRDELRGAAKRYEQVLSALQGEIAKQALPRAPARVQPQLRRVRSSWDPFRSHLDVILQAQSDAPRFQKALAYIQDHAAPLLSKTDRAVRLYQDVHEREIRRLKGFLGGAVVALLATVGILIVVLERGVARPIRRLKDEAEAVAGGDLDRSISVAGTGGEVKALMQSVQKMKERLVRVLKEMKIFRTAVEHAGHSIYWTDAEATIEHVNSAFEEITGYSREQAVGATPQLLQSGAHSDQFYEELWSTIKAGKVWKGEVVDERPDGERYVVNQTIAPIKNGGGKIEHFVAVGSDITEKKRYERALRDERDRFETLFRSLPTPVVRCDYRDGRAVITDANPAFERTFGIATATATGRDIDELLVPDSERGRARELDRTVLEKGILKEEVQRRTAEEIKTFQLWATGWSRGEDPPEIYAIYADISERKQWEERLKRQNERLDRFASVLSHDLRNPLNVAKGRLHLAWEERPSDPSGHLAAVGRSLDRMNEIIEDMLTLTWGREGGDSEDLQACSLERLAERSWQNVDTARATLQVEAAPLVRAEKGRLQQLLENLFRNAIEHAGESVTVTVGAFPSGFYIEDDGPGIPKEKRREVLEAGYTSSSKGTGLGLSIVRTVAQSHDWTLSVTEGREGGARFEFSAAKAKKGEPAPSPKGG